MLDREPQAPGSLGLPAGPPPRLACREAQQVVQLLARELAVPPLSPTPAELSLLWPSAMDPHGLWSAAPDSPLEAALIEAAPDMLRELQEPLRPCAAAGRVAEVWQRWLEELRPIYEVAFEAERRQPPRSAFDVYQLAAEPIFEDDPVTRPGRELARELGRRAGAFAARFGGEERLLEAARSRLFPSDARELSEMAVLAALRTFVPLVDPHSAFAPLDEEWSLYAGDATLDAGSPLWADATRTPLGARVVSEPAPPLLLDDLVLAINGLSLASASVDQIEQAARTSDASGAVSLRVLRRDEPEILSLSWRVEPPALAAEGLAVERIRYGEQAVLRVVIPDVEDDLGEQLGRTLRREREGTGAVLLDLRGNGGGSLDAAVEALGSLLPDVPLFPLIHRGVVTEVLRAPSSAEPYRGPVAALVDGDTASAAEMLAGALQAYRRGLVIGARTFGKGCVQEYFGDVVPSGVLRMTTLQFALPDGRALQQIGLTPELSLPLPPALEREAHLVRQPISFPGPDVRERSVAPGPAWPRASEAAGPCQDPVVCRAIARLASGEPGPRAAKIRAGTR